MQYELFEVRLDWEKETEFGVNVFYSQQAQQMLSVQIKWALNQQKLISAQESKCFKYIFGQKQINSTQLFSSTHMLTSHDPKNTVWHNAKPLLFPQISLKEPNSTQKHLQQTRVSVLHG